MGFCQNQSFTTFKNANDFGDVGLITQTENNMKYWLDWAFLQIGAWTDITSAQTSDVKSSSMIPSRLNWVNEPPAAAGQIWQTRRKDWVYESGVNYIGRDSSVYNPIQISGIYVNSTFYSTGNATLPYFLDYPNGRVTFTNGPISTSAIVTMNYSYRNVQIYRSDQTPWWKTLQYNTTDSPQSQFQQDPRTGDWSIGVFHRIQLPAIMVEALPNIKSRGYELGNGALWLHQDVLYHVLADDAITRNNIASILNLQTDRDIFFFDTNIVNQSGTWPINYMGSLINTNKYPDFANPTGVYAWKKVALINTRGAEIESINPNLYESVTRTTLEMVFGNI